MKDEVLHRPFIGLCSERDKLVNRFGQELLILFIMLSYKKQIRRKIVPFSDSRHMLSCLCSQRP